MDCSEISVEMAEEEPLVITEDGDMAEGLAEKVTEQSCSEESPLIKKEEPTGEDKDQEDVASKVCLGEKQHIKTEEDDAREDKRQGDKPEDTNDGQNGDDSEREEQAHEKPEKPSNAEDEKVPQGLNSSEQLPEGEQKQEEDPAKAHRLTPDFPESLYELLCTLQEGRRLNDQRCSFRLQSGMRRRRCHSEPNTSKPANRVVFSSMTSLQKEEFFDLVATAQARRLDDQRAQLGRSMPPKPKARSFRGSIKQLSFAKKPTPVPEPAPAPKEDLYDMILTTQAQGRLEDQRSRAPGPMDDEDFFSLLLRVQGGRMDEQRTELPRLLQT